MSYPKYRSVEVINNPLKPGSNHREVNCINYRQQEYNNNNNNNDNKEEDDEEEVDENFEMKD